MVFHDAQSWYQRGRRSNSSFCWEVQRVEWLCFLLTCETYQACLRCLLLRIDCRISQGVRGSATIVTANAATFSEAEPQQAEPQQAEPQQAEPQANAEPQSKITSLFSAATKRKAGEMVHEANADEQELEQARAQKKVVRLQVQLAQKELQQLQDAKAECLQLNKGERTIVNAMHRHSVTEVT